MHRPCSVPVAPCSNILSQINWWLKNDHKGLFGQCTKNKRLSSADIHKPHENIAGLLRWCFIRAALCALPKKLARAVRSLIMLGGVWISVQWAGCTLQLCVCRCIPATGPDVCQPPGWRRLLQDHLFTTIKITNTTNFSISFFSSDYTTWPYY